MDRQVVMGPGRKRIRGMREEEDLAEWFVIKRAVERAVCPLASATWRRVWRGGSHHNKGDRIIEDHFCYRRLMINFRS